MDGITPPHLHHFPGTDSESVFELLIHPKTACQITAMQKKMYVELIGFEKWGKSKAHV